MRGPVKQPSLPVDHRGGNASRTAPRDHAASHPRTVAKALQKLKTLGILNWLRRCHEERGPWGIRFKQDTNAYVITEPPILTKDDPPPPESHEWGAVPPLPDTMTQAVEAMRNGDRRTMLAALEADPGDELATLWASFYREIGWEMPD